MTANLGKPVPPGLWQERQSYRIKLEHKILVSLFLSIYV
uniref:Uncharacterized protein n=1 Tax=Anguilla anguilla TaxID=7936 RepID=A0A0E9T758_ANGAN